jgi:hypothetical protein
MQNKCSCSVFIIHRFSKYPEDCPLAAAFNNDASFESSSFPAFSLYLCCNQSFQIELSEENEKLARYQPK